MEEDTSGKAKGGIARSESLTPERRKEIAQQAAAARWESIKEGMPEARNEGLLPIGDVALECYGEMEETLILVK